MRQFLDVIDRREYVKRCKNCKQNLGEVSDYLRHINAPENYIQMVTDASDLIENQY